MKWDLTGKRVEGMYIGKYPVKGVVVESRIKFGGRVQHQVDLDRPLVVYGALRETVTIHEDELTSVAELA